WDKIKTPTLLLHDTGDARVTITQSYSLFHALKDNGVEVKFFAYPVGGHFPGDPVRQMDVYRRWTEWLRQHFKRRPPALSVRKKKAGEKGGPVQNDCDKSKTYAFASVAPAAAATACCSSSRAARRIRAALPFKSRR